MIVSLFPVNAIWVNSYKVEASCEFVKATGGMVGIGSLEDGLAILKGEAGTNIVATHTVNA
jgi:carbamate kinase